MNGNEWREAALIVYFSHDIDTWFAIVSLNTISNQRHASKNVKLNNTFMHIVKITTTCLQFLAYIQAVEVI